jgi:phosphoglycolate phosphatase-like HAD superfamily hydrolase
MNKQSNSPHITTVLFDLDDTLLNSLPSRAEALQHVFNTSGITQYDAAVEVLRLRGFEIKDILLKCGVDNENLNELFNEYRRAYWTHEHRSMTLFSGVNSLLKKLYSNNFKLGLVSQKGRDFLFEGHRAGSAIELEKIGISSLFSIIVGLEYVTKTKPDP